MPSTRPRASSSGPPELPWLIAASVWIAPVVSKPVSDWIERSSAEMTPTESDCSSPNGLPMAATGAPTCRSLVEPSGSGRSVRPVGVDLQQRDVGVGVEADDLGRDLVAVGEPHVDVRGACGCRAPAARDDVGVGRDLAVAGEHEARAEAGASLLPGAARPVADDGHDARRLALVDRLRGSKPPSLCDRPAARTSTLRRRAVHRVRRRSLPAAAAGSQRAPTAARPPATRALSQPAAPARRSCGPGTLVSARSPSMRSASSCAIARPRPEPWASSEV